MPLRHYDARDVYLLLLAPQRAPLEAPRALLALMVMARARHFMLWRYFCFAYATLRMRARDIRCRHDASLIRVIIRRRQRARADDDARYAAASATRHAMLPY